MSAPASPYAKRIVRKIVDDLSDRGGIGNEWDLIDDDVKGEIEEEWCRLIDEQLKGSVL